jgi:arginine/lysine/ornithine decarboxylase
MKPWEEGIRYAEDALSGLRNYKLWMAPVRERSKLVILGDGLKLATNLRCDYNVECEAAFRAHLIAMTGIGDTMDSIKRFCDAVIRLDELQDSSDSAEDNKYKGRPQPKFLTTVRDACLRGMTAEEAPLEESCGHIAGEFLFAYPPGVPLLIPGEMITDETIKFAKNAGSDLYMNGRRSFDGKIKVLP